MPNQTHSNDRKGFTPVVTGYHKYSRVASLGMATLKIIYYCDDVLVVITRECRLTQE